MKKFLITISIVAALVLNANAQGDGFFAYSSIDENRTGGAPINPVDPFSGMNANANGAPIGSGWLLLAGMGAGYALLRRRNEK